MPEEGKKNNDRKGYPEQPQKRASAESHLNLLLVDEQQRRRSVAVPKGAVDCRRHRERPAGQILGLGQARGRARRASRARKAAALAERGVGRLIFRVSTKRNRRGQRPRLQRRPGGSAPGGFVGFQRVTGAPKRKGANLQISRRAGLLLDALPSPTESVYVAQWRRTVHHGASVRAERSVNLA
jgi:hypothetical protein